MARKTTKKTKRKTARKSKEVKLPVRIKKTPQLHSGLTPQQRSGLAPQQSSGQAEKVEELRPKTDQAQAEKVKTQGPAIKKVSKQKTKMEQPSFIRDKTKEFKEKPVKTEKDKRFLMWAGVIFFMVIIFTVWIFNLKSVFKATEDNNVNTYTFKEWDRIADDFSETLEKVKEGMAELKEETREPEQGRNIFEDSATSSEKINEEDIEIEELKKRLEELESQMQTEQATTSDN